ncbi:MAG: thioredoxin family protein [Acidobacteria bacterium]|nr:thioredoxin family protein [Acidobacteriota bacterium]
MTHYLQRLVLAALAISAVFPLKLAAQQVPPDAVLRNFELSSDYLLEIDGQEHPKAKIYQSKTAGAILIRAASLDSPVLLSPRAGSVETVSIMSLNMQPTGAIDILANAALIPQGRFKIDGENVLFSVGGHEAKLKPRPPLTGLHDRVAMLDHSPAYGPKAEAYTPDPAVLDRLRQQDQPVRVRVFFGSWCPFCQQYVPRMLKVDELLAGSKIEIEYYGLPHPPWDDEPAVKAEKVSGVPTGIVYAGSRELGRIQGDQWSNPEKAIRAILGDG